MMRSEHVWVLFLFLIVTVILSVRFLSIDHSATAEWGYVNAGAINPYYGISRPFGYRLLMPVFLNVVGIVPKPGEPWIPVPAAVLMCVLFYAFLRAVGFSRCESTFAALFLSLSGGMIDILKDFGINNTDASAHIFILLALWAMARRVDALFSFSVMLGVFNREWALVLLPAWYLFFYGFRVSGLSILRFLRVSLPSIAVYWMVRTIYFPHCALGVMGSDLSAIMPPSETTTLFYYWTELQTIDWSLFTNRLVSRNFYEFGLIALLPFAVRAFPFLLDGWKRVCIYYVFICILQFTVAADIWRLAFYLFPVLIPVFVLWLRWIGEQLGSRVQVIAGGLTSILVLKWPESIWMFFVSLVTCLGVEQYRRYSLKIKI
ncbi:MAG: hypothetical protein C4527_10055 [Candidatus Omnitrophota bacterium]|nr:MAG: hypothetical protein C4527_10055 [Candidatus Omnitrophota bacterium]